MTRFSALGAVRFADRIGRRHGGLNWSGGLGTGFHKPSLTHRQLVKRILMYYQAEPGISDIPRGEVVGSYAFLGGPETNQAPVNCGLDYMDWVGRTPCH